MNLMKRPRKNIKEDFFSFRMTEQMSEQLDILAVESERSCSEVVREALRLYIKNENNQD